MIQPIPNVWRDDVWWFKCDHCGLQEWFETTEQDALQFGNDHYMWHCPNTNYRSED